MLNNIKIEKVIYSEFGVWWLIRLFNLFSGCKCKMLFFLKYIYLNKWKGEENSIVIIVSNLENY